MDRQLTLSEKTALMVSTGLGTGYFPEAPGTAGSAVGIFLGWALSFLSPGAGLLIIIVIAIIGSWAGDITEMVLAEKDPGIVVIDEIVGMAISMWCIEPSWLSMAGLFLLFRLFDIWKPFPVRNMEEMFPGGIGIIMDDVLAGVYANILWRAGSSFLS